MASKWIVLAMSLVALEVRAELPAGAYVVEVPASRGLAVPTGDAVDCSVRNEIERCLSLTLATSTAGEVTGAGALTLEELDGGFNGEMAVDLEGRVAGSASAPKASLRYTLDGEIVEAGPDPNTPGRVLDVEGSGRFDCKLDPLAFGLLRCKGSARFCAFFEEEKVGCDKIPFVLPVELERIGFDLVLALATAEDGEVGGEASCEIDGEEAFAYTVRGKYKASSDASKLALTGVDPEAKTKVTLKGLELEQGGAVAGKLRFTLSGQRGTFVLVEPEPASLSAADGD